MEAKNRTLKWDKRFLSMADFVSVWSKDPSTKVGAVTTDSLNRVLGVGYNGFPRGVTDFPAWYNDRKEKYPRVVHAEANAILNSTGSLTGATIYCSHFPCSSCAGLIIQSGIISVVSYVPEGEFADRFKDSFNISENMFNHAGVSYWLYDKD